MFEILLKHCKSWSNHILSAIHTSTNYRKQQWARTNCKHSVSWKNSVQQQKLLKNCDTDFPIVCCECALNVINDTVGINLKEQRFYENNLESSVTNQRRSRNAQKFDIFERSENNETDKSSSFLLFDRLIFVMKTHEVILRVLWQLVFVKNTQQIIRIPVSTHNKTIQHYTFRKTQELNKKQTLWLYSKERKRSQKPH